MHIKSAADSDPYKIAVLGVLFEISNGEKEESEPEVLSQIATLGRAAKSVLEAGE